MRSSCGNGALKSAEDRAGRGGGWPLKGLEDAREAVMIYMKEKREQTVKR